MFTWIIFLYDIQVKNREKYLANRETELQDFFKILALKPTRDFSTTFLWEVRAFLSKQVLDSLGINYVNHLAHFLAVH